MVNELDSAELAIIISHSASTSGIIVLLKMPPKYRKLKQCPKIMEHGIIAHTCIP